MQLRNKIQINQNYNVRQLVPNFISLIYLQKFSEAPQNWRFPQRPQNIEALFMFSQDPTEHV